VAEENFSMLIKGIPLDQSERYITPQQFAVTWEQLQIWCGMAWDFGAREWEHERSQLAFDRLLSGVDGSALSLDQAVKEAIGDSMVDRAVAVLRGTGREFLVTPKAPPDGPLGPLAELQIARIEVVRRAWREVVISLEGSTWRKQAEGEHLIDRHPRYEP
jgi:hypothetical protein